MTIKKLSTVLLALLAVLPMGILACTGLLFGDDSEGDSSTELSSGGSSVSLEALKHRPLIEKHIKGSDILEYVPILLAIIQIESNGTIEDVMQSSESAGFPFNSLSIGTSTKRGCIYFASSVNRAKDIGCDQKSITQPYNYGGGYLDYVEKSGKEHSLASVESSPGEELDGEKVTYSNPIAIRENGGWRYDYGDMFCIVLVK